MERKRMVCRIGADACGSVTVEASMTIGLFLFIVMCCLELALFVFDVTTMRFAMDVAVREAVVDARGIDELKERIELSLFRPGGVTGAVRRSFEVERITICPGFEVGCEDEGRGLSEGFFTVHLAMRRRFLAMPFDYPIGLQVAARNENIPL